MRLNLRNRFLIPTCLVLILALGLVIAVSFVQSRQALQGAVDQQISEIAASASKTLAWWFQDRKLDLASWSEEKVFSTSVQDGSAAESARKSAGEQLAKIKKSYKYYEELCLAAPNGELIASSDAALMGKINVKDRGYFKEAMAGRLAVSEALKSRATGNPVVTVASPVLVESKPAGVLFGVVDLASFSSLFIDPIKVGRSGYAYVYDQRGLVLAHPDKTNILKLDMNEFDFGKKMIARGSGLLTYTWKGSEKMVAFVKDQQMGWTIGVGAVTAELMAPVRSIGLWSLAIGLACLVLAGVVIFFVAQSISKPITRIITGLSQGADRVSSGSSQISASSSSLAEGTSEQAASLEETSSSLEEMSSMVKSNADNAAQADTLTKEAGQTVEKVNGGMGEMALAMAKIAEAGGQISKIVKSIDEIAFQTNLLALNAAVEAARAGEAGMGFAVVADEVRSLALRAAEAAKSTQALVEDTVRRINHGSELVSTSQEGFREVAESSSKTASLISEIAAASAEQAEGIDQVARAVAEMDKVVQNNAASAEEGASASQEMHAQAAAMKDYVQDLLGVVSGRTKVSSANGHGPAQAPKSLSKGKSRPKPQARPAKSDQSRSKPLGAREVTPQQAIPFEEDGTDSLAEF